MIKDSISEMIKNGASRAEIMEVVEKQMKAVDEEKKKAAEADKRKEHKEDILAILKHFDNIMIREGLISEDERGGFIDSPIVDFMIDTVVKAGKETREMMNMIGSVPITREKRATIKEMYEDGSIDEAIENFLRTL